MEVKNVFRNQSIGYSIQGVTGPKVARGLRSAHLWAKKMDPKDPKAQRGAPVGQVY